ncbi:MAG: transporter substrate-binding domain-containing protein, partial [Burkholderiaceae bacterium]|jgi:polar amino acid transport system substrate-binding protein|nr:transporter substrate-binding domain-containing protein [Burkholderiaceae bacterium]
MLFSKPYIANEQVIIAKKALAQKLNKLEDLKGLTVAVQSGTTADEGARKLLKEKPGLFTLKSYIEATRALDDLGLGRVQVVVIDSVVGLYYVGLNKDKDFAYASASLPPEPIGLAFRKDDAALKAKVDKIIDDMRADGTLQTISKKWFDADLVSHVKEEYPIGSD